MKNNIDYYRHESISHNHPKFKTLRVKYGWEGEGRFWALNNMIAQSEDCVLDLSKNYNKSSIAVDLNMNLEDFNAFIAYLNEECSLINIEDDKITTDITQETLEKVMKERQRNKKNYEERVETEIKPVENIQSKTNKTKVKESKEQQSKVNNIFGIDINTDELSLYDEEDLLLFFNKKFNCCWEKTDYMKTVATYGLDRLRDHAIRMPYTDKSPIGFIKVSLKKNYALKD